MVYLEEISKNYESIIVDSIPLSKSDEFIFVFSAKDSEAKLYNIIYDWSKIPLFAAAGDRIEINSVGNISKNYTIDGSKESELVRLFYQEYIGGMQSLDAIANRYAAKGNTEEDLNTLKKEYHDTYNGIKRAQLKFIIENKANLAAVYALYQRLPNDSYLFNGNSDVVYYRTVVEALKESYPNSPYYKAVVADVENFDKLHALTANMETANYPDINIPDMYGNKQRLSDLEGNVILLDFWSAQAGNSNQNNAELKEIYEKYHSQGFEIYQVGVDSSKSLWINTIQEQKLPWISVSDLKGSSSSILSIYNISRIPSNFIISREGDLVVRDAYGKDLIKYIESELAK